MKSQKSLYDWAVLFFPKKYAWDGTCVSLCFFPKHHKFAATHDRNTEAFTIMFLKAENRSLLASCFPDKSEPWSQVSMCEVSSSANSKQIVRKVMQCLLLQMKWVLQQRHVLESSNAHLPRSCFFQDPRFEVLCVKFNVSAGRNNSAKKSRCLFHFINWQSSTPSTRWLQATTVVRYDQCKWYLRSSLCEVSPLPTNPKPNRIIMRRVSCSELDVSPSTSEHCSLGKITLNSQLANVLKSSNTPLAAIWSL
jgi:hypothetical protein